MWTGFSSSSPVASDGRRRRNLRLPRFRHPWAGVTLPRMKHLMIVLLAMTTAACTAHVGAHSKTIPSDAAGICEQQCQQIGLHMSAVAIMADTIGCVCQAAAPVATADNAGATAAGMATIMFQQQAARQQQQAAQSQPAK